MSDDENINTSPSRITGVGGGGACKLAHHLAKMRVKQKPQTPTTPMTPVAPFTPTMPHICAQEECVMEGE